MDSQGNHTFEDVVASAVNREIEKAVKDATENAKNELNRRIPEIVAGLSISIMKRVSFETRGQELLIHIKLDDSRKIT